MSSSPFLSAAHRIGARLVRDAIHWEDECNWLGEELSGCHAALPPNLYRGSAGIAAFLYLLAEATGEPLFRSTALAGITNALRRLPGLRGGFYEGAHGIAWAARLTGQPAALPETPPCGRDLISGAAGAIVASLLCEDRAQALRHAETLLALAPESPRLTGFSHGASGIAFALLDLFQVTGDARFRDAALAELGYEQSCYSPAHRNWPDLRQPGQPSYPALWCHGAPGIALARLRAWRVLGQSCFLHQAVAALETTRDAIQPESDWCLCHGNSGRLDILLTASLITGDLSWRRSAEAAAEAAAGRYPEAGLPWPCGVPGAGETPALMTGLAGIGWLFLRLHHPALPSPLFPAVASLALS